MLGINTNRILICPTIVLTICTSRLSSNVEIIEGLSSLSVLQSLVTVVLSSHGNLLATELLSIEIWILNHRETLVIVASWLLTMIGRILIMIVLVIAEGTSSFSLTSGTLRSPNFIFFEKLALLMDAHVFHSEPD